MSWLQDLAGKAENMLNKLDQNAAEVLSSSQPSQSELKTLPNSDISTPTIKPLVAPTLRGSPMTLKASPRKPVKFVIDPDEMTTTSRSDLESEAEEKTSSRHSSVSSKLGTIIEKSDVKPQVAPTSEPATFKSDYDELLAMKIVLADVKAERDNLKLELDSLVNELNEARNNSRIRELEDLVQCLSDEKQALTDKYRQTETANSQYIKSISELESTLSKLHQTELELRERFESAKSEAKQAVQELQQYRHRAQLTLAAKEKLIEQLKVGATSVGGDEDTVSNAFDLEIGQLKAERKDLLDEIGRSQEKYDQLKQCFDNLEVETSETVKALKAKLSDSQAALQKDTRLTQQLQDEVKAERRDLEAVRAEMQRQRLQFTTQLHEKDQQLQRLQAKVAQKRPAIAVSSQDGDAMENRIQALTASLVQKQTNLEVAMAEKNALRLQLEKLETRLALELKQSRPQIIHINSENVTDDAKSLVPNFIQENPFDTRFARRFKRAYSSLDAMGIRLGGFMRYPLARLMIIFYIFILHMFIFLLLLSSTPS